MAIHNKQIKYPVQWSRDYVEHLRTVHFALITVCVVMLLLLFSAKYDGKKAASQMAQVLTYLSSWPQGMPPDAENHILKSSVHDAAFQQSFIAQSDSHDDVTFHVTDSTFVCFPDPEGGHYSPLSDARPTNGTEVAVLWDALAEPLRVDSILRIDPTGVQSEQGAVQEQRIRIKGGTLNHSSPGVVELILKGSGCSLDQIGHLDLIGALGRRTFQFTITTVDSGALTQVNRGQHFRIRTLDSGKRLRAYLKKQTTFQDHPFFFYFPDLARAMVGRSEESLDTLSRQIFDEASKETESFEILGIRFPAGTLIVLGPLIPVVLQIYLFVYLQDIRCNIRADDPGWDVPWIGTNRTFLGKGLFFFTTVILPIFVVHWLLAQPLISDFKAAPSWAAFVTMTVHRPRLELVTGLIQIVLQSSLTVFLAISSWCRRPSSNQPTASAQRFE